MKIKNSLEKNNSNIIFDLFNLSFSPFFIALSLKLFLNYGFKSQFNISLIIISLIIFSILGVLKTHYSLKSFEKRTIPTVLDIPQSSFLKTDMYHYMMIHSLIVLTLFIPSNIFSFEIISLIIITLFIYYKWYSSTSLGIIIPFILLGYKLYKIEFINYNEIPPLKKALILSKEHVSPNTQIRALKINSKLYIIIKFKDPIKFLTNKL